MQTKVCPGCGAEYFSHVEECIDCHQPLKTADEIEMESSGDGSDTGEMAPVREGTGPWLKELREVLESSGISSCISLSPGCKPGACGSTSLLFVPVKDLEKAHIVLNKYYIDTHPEAQHAITVDDESCPACGHPAGADAKECPDCGLALAFDE